MAIYFERERAFYRRKSGHLPTIQPFYLADHLQANLLLQHKSVPKEPPLKTNTLEFFRFIYPVR